MELKKTIKRLLPDALLVAVRNAHYKLKSAPPDQRNQKYWFDQDANFVTRLEEYYSQALEAPHRRMLLEEFKVLAPSLPKPLRIVEFGAFAGANLRVLSEGLSNYPIELYATDPHPTAVEFIVKHVPQARAFQVTAKEFPRFHSVDSIQFSAGVLFFVLSFLSPKECLGVIRKMTELCDRIFIYDGLLNLKGNRSFGGDAHGNVPGNTFYYHPYERFLKSAGFEIEKTIDDPSSEIAKRGMLVAHRQRFL